MAKTTTTETPVREVKALALKQELGRRRNNKTRKANGDKPVKSKAFYLAAFSTDEVTALMNGETITKTYGSGRTESYKIVVG